MRFVETVDGGSSYVRFFAGATESNIYGRQNSTRRAKFVKVPPEGICGTCSRICGARCCLRADDDLASLCGSSRIRGTSRFSRNPRLSDRIPEEAPRDILGISQNLRCAKSRISAMRLKRETRVMYNGT